VQELQRDIEQHTRGVASVLSLCDVLLRDEDAAGGSEPESDSLQETSHSLDRRWRAICAMALDKRLRWELTHTHTHTHTQTCVLCCVLCEMDVIVTQLC